MLQVQSCRLQVALSARYAAAWQPPVQSDSIEHPELLHGSTPLNSCRQSKDAVRRLRLRRVRTRSGTLRLRAGPLLGRHSAQDAFVASAVLFAASWAARARSRASRPNASHSASKRARSSGVSFGVDGCHSPGRLP